MSAAEAPRLLPCGFDFEAIVRQVVDGAPAQDPLHQRGCEFCQAALESVRRMFADLRGLAEEHIAVPRSFAAGIMGRLRSEAEAIEVADGTPGETRVAERLVGRVAREAAAATPGVVYASAGASTAEGSEAFRVLVRIRLVVTLERALADIGRDVRDRVAAEVQRTTGLEARPVDVVVEDVLEDEGPPG